jgi:precorrin-6Y C5,15-methyltransferase (decarboxylating)
MTVLEHMGGPGERIIRFEAQDGAGGDLADFNTLAIECAAEAGIAPGSRAAGLANELFRNDGQMTKREVRAASVGALMPYPDALLWDIGAGCGSVAIEWMRAARGARAIAIEPRENRRALLADNALSLGVPEIEIVSGRAPDDLAALPQPDAIFIGGGLSRDGVFEKAWQALRRGGRMVANAVTLESEARLMALHRQRGGELARISVAHAEAIGSYTGWRPAMPVTMWSITKGGSA